MKALVIAPQPFFSPRGTPFSVYYRTLIMAQMGVEVDLLTYGEGQDVDIPGVTIHRIPRFSALGEIKIGPSLLKLYLDVFLFVWILKLLLHRRYDFVHAHEEAIFFCFFLKPLFRFKLIYDMHSSLPQQLTNFQFTTSGFLIGCFELLERACLSAADAIITICPDLADYVARSGEYRGKHVMIENSLFEPVRLCPMERDGKTGPSPSGEAKPPPDPFPQGLKVVYAGTLEPYQGIEILLRAFRIVVQREPRGRLLVVGGTTAQVMAYENLARQLGIQEAVAFTGRVSQMRAKGYIGLAQALVSPRSSGTNTPLKVYEQLASGIPLVATAIHSHTQVLTPDVAFLVKPEPVDMARGLLAALDPHGKGPEIARAARELYRREYDRPVYEAKMRRVLGMVS